MLQAFLYGAAGMAGALIVYTAYDGLYTFCAWMHSKKNASANSKRRKRQETRYVVPNVTNGRSVYLFKFTEAPKIIYNIIVKNKKRKNIFFRASLSPFAQFFTQMGKIKQKEGTESAVGGF